MLTPVLSVEGNGTEALPGEVEVRAGWGDTVLISAYRRIKDGILPGCFGAAP